MKKISDEVYYLDENQFSVSREDITKLKEIALSNKSGKARLCTHSTTEDTIHEMFIVHTRDTLVKPHKHTNKVESFHILEGTILLTIYSDLGEIQKQVELSSIDSTGTLYYKIEKNTFHTIEIFSDVAVFKETTQGPFQNSNSIFATWNS